MDTLSRSRRAFWGDLRFLVGLALIGLSITGVWLVVSTAGSTSPVLQATRTIVEGEAVGDGDFQIVDANLGAASAHYLAPGSLDDRQIASRTLRAGELVPASALADADSRRTTTIVVETGTAVADDVETGSLVEVWEAPPPDEEGIAQEPPRILIDRATVSSLHENRGVLTAEQAGIELVVQRSDVAAVLAAVTAKSQITVVPIGAAP